MHKVAKLTHNTYLSCQQASDNLIILDVHVVYFHQLFEDTVPNF